MNCWRRILSKSNGVRWSYAKYTTEGFTYVTSCW